MGTDNLHHKRKSRNIRSFQRKNPIREPYDMVLIVCEGEKTEPNYFKELRAYYRLNNVNVEIDGEQCGSSPLNVVNYAIDKYNKSKKAYDKIFCVFDKDTHPTYNEAKDKIKRARLNRGHTIEAIDSVPCFEFWLLLHFLYSTRPFSAAGKRSICDSVIRSLNSHMPGYEKGAKKIAEKIMPDLNKAISNSKKLETYHQTSGTDNPSTKIHVLVEYLKDLRK